jgi:hypothetical protein
MSGDFRPGYEVRRYAEGKWIPDDGEYDLAFAADRMCLYIDPSYQKNIRWRWVDKHWSSFEPNHPRGNAWHYMLAEGEKEWGGPWGRDAHPNSIASKSGMDLMCAEYRCANGDPISFDLREPHIAAGLVRDRDTKAVLTFPEKPICMYCGPLAFRASEVERTDA